MIYADNAATTRTSDTARQAMEAAMDQHFANPSSLHTAGQLAKEALEDARARIAALIHCKPNEIIFTSGGTEADNQALISCATWGAKRNKRHIVTTAFEHHAVLYTAQKLEKQGYEVTYLDVHEDGMVRPEEVEAAIRPDTCLVSVMMANNEIGSVQPIAEIGEICRRRGVFFHTDAVQAAGHLPIDVQAQNIDLLSLSAHKFFGPRGIGVLYARTGVPVTRIQEGGAQERGKRPGTENLPAICGMAAALEEAYAHLEQNTKTICAMRDRLIEGLSQIPHSVLNGSREHRLPGNVSFCFEGIEGESLLLMLDEYGICASSGSACTSGSLDPSHVLLAIGRPHEIAHGSLRLSICENNTMEETEQIIRATTETVATLRGMSPVWRDLQEGRKQYVIQ